MSDRSHQCQFRVYYEDTDAGGVVYYANYLKFAERARTELLRDRSLVQTDLAQTHDILFVVRHASLDLRAPARLDDLLTVETKVTSFGGASIEMTQDIFNAKGLCATIQVKIACITSSFSPIRIPAKVREALS